MERKIICLSSGGIDSFALLNFFKNLEYKIKILFVNYGQLSHFQEYNSVLNIANSLEIEDIIKIDLENYGKLFCNSLIIENEFENEFFPGRNSLLLNIAASICYEWKIPEIGIGIIFGSRIFLDCTRIFLKKMEECFNIAYNYFIGIQAPLDNFSKIEVLKYLKENNLPIEITYSCQKGGINPCNKCPSCIERNDALKELNF